MTTLREAAQQALEGLEKWRYDKDPRGADDYIAILRAALAEPVQEPIAWLYRDHKGQLRLNEIQPKPYFAFPVYTAPPQRKPLTDEEIDDLSRTMVKGDKSVNWLCRAIERAHGIGEKE